jgi:ABC-type lipoprotein export system ATPase subunit
MHPIDRRIEIIRKNMQVRINVDSSMPTNKVILHNSSGYAKPKEMVAIMGASGSGKTSLLNILGQRLDLSKGS